MYEERKGKQAAEARFWAKVAIGVVCILVFGIFGGMFGCPKYNVWQKALEGEAELKKAEWNRQIAIKEAEAKLQSAKSLADAEIERARGVARANEIIGGSLKNNENYLRYLWIHNLEESQNKGTSVIYVPTEGNIPIMEAGRSNR